jgi:CubicO group peptidase (beta-lactamase class C family)
MKFQISSLFFIILLICSSEGKAIESVKSDESSLPTLIDSLLSYGLEQNMYPGASLTLYHQDTLYFFNYGYARIQNKLNTSSSTKYHLGSLGKLLTSIAVLQQVEKSKLDLFTDISDYIGDMGINAEIHGAPLTLHHLLTHSAGFNEVNIGYMARNPEEIITLEEFILQSNPGLFQEPGKEIIYSNYAYALAGYIVQRVTGIEFSDYILNNIFTPLRMKNSSFGFQSDYYQDDQYSSAYNPTKEGFSEVLVYPRHAIPAGSLVSSPEDMGIFIKALFNRSTNLLQDDCWNLFFTEQFTVNQLLNGYSYGLEKQSINGKQAWAKGGMLPGALSHILILPDEFALFLTVNTGNDNFGEFFFKSIFDTFYPQVQQAIDWKEDIAIEKYCGTYRNKRYSRKSADNIVSLFKDNFTIYANVSKDTMLAFHNGAWHHYLPIEKGVFQNIDQQTQFFIFKEDSQKRVSTLYRDLNIGGLTIQSSFEKTSWYNSPTFVNEHYAIILLIIVSGLTLTLIRLFILVIQWLKKDFQVQKLLPSRIHILLIISILIMMLQIKLGPLYLFKNTSEFLFGYPPIFKASFLLGYVLIPLSLGLGYSIWQLWKKKQGRLIVKIHLSFIEISLLIHLGYLFYWDLL